MADSASAMTPEQFEGLLTEVARRLTVDVQADKKYHTPSAFEDRCRLVIREIAQKRGINVGSTAKAQTFPDIVVGEFGVEVKFNSKDSWRSVANSVFEGSRDENVKYVYVLFGKMGGNPTVKWAKYDHCVMHVRTSHVPRFEVEVGTEKSLFVRMKTSYEEFRKLPQEKKMHLIREYARARLKTGERLWWLEDKPVDEQHTLPLEVRLYMTLPQKEKRRLRAEAALLCPQVVKPSRSKHKYDDAVLYLMTYHGVLAPQARDLFTAGSVALRADAKRGGNYMMRSLQDIEPEMRRAANSLEDALFAEYWGFNVPAAMRISQWLKMADTHANDWKPSEHLFHKKKRST